MKVVLVIGRILYSVIFLMTLLTHFSPEMAKHAADHGVPFAEFLVPVSGILACTGALSIVAGFKARWGAWLIIFFLIPVTIMMHDFWNLAEPKEKQIQMIMFLKNISMLGAAMIIAYFGSGPVSIDGLLRKEATGGK